MGQAVSEDGMALSQENTYRLIGGAGARGLSGDARRVLPVDPSLDFFDACLRRHRAVLDLVADPDQVWDAEKESGGTRPMGLEAHLGSVSRERLVSLTDVLVVVSKEDWSRAHSSHGSRWTRHLVGGVRASFEDWCGRAEVTRHNPHRPFGVRVVVDGGSDLQGESLGLGSGEFVTGLLPNHYGGPATASRPLISVMLNMPGVWMGYREVARLYDDQDLLTLGSHWLDNFSHPALVAPALYRLHYDPQEGLVHLTSPDVAGGFGLTRHGDPAGTSVYGITRGDGHVVAWLVLAMVETPQPSGPTPVVVEAVPTVDPIGQIMEADTGPLPQVRGPLEDSLSSRPTLLNGLSPSISSTGDGLGPVTAEAAGMVGKLLRVREAGVLLQRVHFRDVMLGYEVFISASGDIGSELADPVATVQVLGHRGRVRLYAHTRGIRVAGMPVPIGAAAVLGSSVEIDVSGVVLEYCDLSNVRLKGWPYVGEIRRSGANLHLMPGAVHVIGRAPGSRVKLPDDGHHGNILWRPEVDAGHTIRSQNGEIPKSRFTLDSIMVASSHAELDLTGESPVLRNVARSCYSFIRRSDGDVIKWVELSRVQRSTGSFESELRSGDELLVGNCVLEVVLDSAAEVDLADIPTASRPPVVFSLADDLSEELVVPPPPLLPVPRAAEPPPPAVRGAGATWMEPNADDDPTGLPTGGSPTPYVPSVDLVEHKSLAIEPVTAASLELWGTTRSLDPPPETASSVDEQWSPLDSAKEDPTEVPMPHFFEKP